jgi:hypothetical protein
VAVYGIDMAAINFGFGTHYLYIPTTDLLTLNKLFFAADMVWTWSICFVKVSVSLMFLRFARTLDWPGWKALMCFSIVYLVGAAIAGLYLGITTCTPVNFQWDKSIPGGRCRSPEKIRATILGLCLMVVVSDFQFALLPLTFISSIKRSALEKAVILGIMSLGLMASIIGCVKYLHFNLLFSSRDQPWDSVSWKVVSNAEVDIAIIAACIPPLKSLGETFLKRFKSMKPRSGSPSKIDSSDFQARISRTKGSAKATEDKGLCGGQCTESGLHESFPELELVLPRVSDG